MGSEGAVAQLGERLLCKQEVIGSIPFSSTNRIVSEGGLVGIHEIQERLEASVKSFASGLSISPKSTSVVL